MSSRGNRALARLPLSTRSAQLRESEERFRRLFADAPAGMLLLEASGVIQDANAAFCRYAKRSEEEVVGSNYLDLVFPENREEYARLFASHLTGNAADPIERRFRAKDGSEVWALISMSVVAESERARVVVHVQDMTEQRRMRLELEERNGQLQESDRLKDELISVVSHDLRTPLTSIIGYLELAVADDTGGEISKERRGFLEVAQRNSQRLFRLVEDLLFVSRTEAGCASLDLAPLDVSQLVREAVDATLPIAVAGGVQVSYHGAAGGEVLGDAHRIAEVVENLLTNAVKFTAESGRVDVRVVAHEDEVVIRVTDTGPGISEADRPHLFDRFFRATRAEAFPGSGLGLSIVKAIVDAHGGSIGVESREGEGTSFEVRLWRAGPPGDPVAAAA
ncbi:MAG: PAS domain-containing sensor histidine kinase [Gaiellaceae bacterium]